MDWVERIGPYRVRKMEGPRPGNQPYLRLDPNPSYCVHTTEGNTVAGAVATLRDNFTAPHFVVGEDSIVQMRPLWAQGATVHEHNALYIQVECVGRAQREVHRLTPSTWEPLVALTGWVHEQLGIPLWRPAEWSDRLPAGTIADNNARRQTRIAVRHRGVFGHVDVPDQAPTWHWDPGSLDYTSLFQEAGGDDMTPEQLEMLRDSYAVTRAVEDYLNSTPPPEDSNVVRRRTYKALVQAGDSPAPADHTHPLPDHNHPHGHSVTGTTT